MEFLNINLGEFIFTLAIITLSLTIILRKYTILTLQIALLAAVLFIPDFLDYTAGTYVLLVLQIVLFAFALFRYKKAIDLNYRLIRETTHEIPKNITAGGGFGGICKYPR